jgi:hypothetical protein
MIPALLRIGMKREEKMRLFLTSLSMPMERIKKILVVDIAAQKLKEH